MKWIELSSPILRAIEEPHRAPVLRLSDCGRLLSSPRSNSALFFDIIEKRETRRTFGVLSFEQLSSLLWYTAKTRRVRRDSGIVKWESRPTPSAGGKHPIEVLLLTRGDVQPVAWIYDPMQHSLLEFEDLNASSFFAFWEHANDLVSIGNGMLIWFVADFQKTMARYENGESLVWRDAGALIAQMSLVAEALGLNSCALGSSGEPYCSELLAQPDLRGVGGLIVGGR